VRAVAVDATTGEVRDRDARAELINADFLSMRSDGAGGFKLSMANQFRAFANHLWDIPERLTARDALVKATKLLVEQHGDRQWQLAFLSNTGMTEKVLGQSISDPADALTTRAGWAGQWVVEVCGAQAIPVREGGRSGFAYDYRKILCTASGAVDISPYDQIAMPRQLAETPIPGVDPLVEVLDRARETAIRRVGNEFTTLSVVLARTPPAATWHFRFHRGHDPVADVVVSVDGTTVYDG
jgi:hypothetical protein